MQPSFKTTSERRPRTILAVILRLLQHTAQAWAQQSAMAETSDVDNNATTTTTEAQEESSSSNAPANAPVSEPASTCAQCGKSPESLKQCLKCHSVSYCNKDCQKANFKVHKKVCASLAQEYTKAHEPKMASRSTASTKGARDRGLQKWQVSLKHMCPKLL